MEEISGLRQLTGIRDFFGTDDNFFNSRRTVQETFTAMANAKIGRKRMGDVIWFGTEATEYDVHRNLDLLSLCREGGLRAIWFGIEDVTASLVKKGQNAAKTVEVFNALVAHDIAPMPMLIHHDGQPFWSRGLYGLLNQVRFVKKAGALSVQVSCLTPMVGTKGYEQPFADGIVMEEVAGASVDDHLYDGTHCIATHDPKPWLKELMILTAYALFYNPANFISAVFKWDSLWSYRLIRQAVGFVGLLKTIYEKLPWILRLLRGPIQRWDRVPKPTYPMAAPIGTAIGLVHYHRPELRMNSDSCSSLETNHETTFVHRSRA